MTCRGPDIPHRGKCERSLLEWCHLIIWLHSGFCWAVERLKDQCNITTNPNRMVESFLPASLVFLHEAGCL